MDRLFTEIQVSCNFHSLYIYICGESFFRGKFKGYISNQLTVLGGRKDLTNGMLLE